MDKNLIDVASGGILFNKTPTEARNLIETMVSNAQQFSIRFDNPPKRVNEVQACDICTSPGHIGHATDMFPKLQEPPTEHVDVIRGFSRQQQRRYDPFSNIYNPGWKNHSNLSY
ncbi:UNVERIFIED_CONTAM: hypothetical protein Scaly_1645400 [Sesamum calycinum]|uniref:Uncharacterized protein n=1 Tax=Sesamum calycinum TaxID=2727403 RepID=A0AAW2P9H5_9LAMI